MRLLQLTYRLTLFVFFVSAIWHPTIRHYAGLARWPMLGLLLFACMATPPPRRRPIDGKVVVLFLCFLLAALYSTAVGIAADKSILRLLSVLLIIIAAAILSGAWADQRGRDMFLAELVFMARFVAFSSFLLLVARVNLGRVPGRFSGWTSNPNELGTMLLLLTVPVLHRAMTAPSRGFRSERLLLGVIGVVLLATGSRGAILGIAFGVLVYLWSVRKVSIRSSLVAAALSALLYTAVGGADTVRQVPGLRRLVPKDSIEDDLDIAELRALSGRGEVWKLTLELFEKNPWRGYGWGVESELLEIHSDRIHYHQGAHVHNSYLSLLLQVGLLGAIPIVLLLLTAVRRSGRAILREHESSSIPSGHAGVLLAMFVGGLAHAFVESWLFATGNLNSLIFWPVWFMLLRGYLKAPAQGAVAPQREPFVELELTNAQDESSVPLSPIGTD